MDTEEEHTNDKEEINMTTKCSQISSTEQTNHTTSEGIRSSFHLTLITLLFPEPLNQPNSTPVIPAAINLLTNISTDVFNSIPIENLLFTPTKSRLPAHASLNNRLKTTLENLPNDPSPYSSIGGRRFSSASSSSLIFDTPCSSFSRTTTSSNTISTPKTIIKIDRETEIIHPSHDDMMKQLILNMYFNVNNHTNKIIYNPTELAKQCTSLSLKNNYPPINLSDQKQFLHFGRYEIEILFPMNDDKVKKINHIIDYF